MMPDIAIVDLPHLSIIWGAFDERLFWENRDRLLTRWDSSELAPYQQELLASLSDDAISDYTPFLRNTNQWTEVKSNIIKNIPELISDDYSRLVDSEMYVALMRRRLDRAVGKTVVMGTSHYNQFLTHVALHEESADNGATIAEIVFDRHIDSIAAKRPISSANFYWHLKKYKLIEASAFIGARPDIMDLFLQSGESKKLPKNMVTHRDMKPDETDEILHQMVQQLVKWNITNVTYSVDLDVLSPTEGGMSVRYSPLLSYLGLGCQLLPERLLPPDLNVMNSLLYPTPDIRHFLQPENIPYMQDAVWLRQNISHIRYPASLSRPLYAGNQLLTTIVDAGGLSLNRTKELIEKLKTELRSVGVREGIQLKSGATYTGSVVEMFGFESVDHATSKAAIELRDAINA